MPTEKYTIELPGLREDVARDLLAAIGLLRLLDLKWPEHCVKLMWHQEAGHPVIQCALPLPNDWCAQLIADIQSLEEHADSPMFHGEIIKADYRVFREATLKAVRFAGEAHPLAKLPELLFAAYGSQTPDPKTGMIDPTMFSFANGQSGKSLLRDVRELIRKWNSEETLAALLGTAKAIVGKSFRWMPQEYRPAAHRAHDPGSKVKGDESLDYPALNILAFFGLSCLSTATRGDTCETAGFHRDEVGWCFRWPIWDHPLAVTEVASLLSLEYPPTVQLPGISRVWRSRRLVAEKSVYFAPATLA